MGVEEGCGSRSESKSEIRLTDVWEYMSGLSGGDGGFKRMGGMGGMKLFV